MTDQTTPQPGDREAVARVVFHDDYELSILLEPDGRLRRVVHAVGVEGTELFTRSDATVVDNARHGDGGEQRAAEWAERLERLQTEMRPIHYRTTPPGAAPGQPETVECIATPIPAADGSLDSILLQAYDRTTTDWVLAQLRESQTMFSLMADSLPQMIWIADADGQVTYFSPQWAQFTGRSTQDLLGQGFLDLVHPDDVERIRSNRGSTDEFAVLTFRLLRHDGDYRWVEAEYRTLFGEDGTPVRWVGATSDVSDRLDAEAAARELQEQLRVALSVTRMGRYALYFGPIGVGRITGDSRFFDILGVDVPEVMRRGGLPELFAMIHDEDREYVEAAVEAAVSGGPDYDVEYRMWRPTDDGSGATELRWVGARGRVEFADDGVTAVRMLGVVEDITDRRAEQEARLRWQKHEAIGSLAGGVAHDFNNVISAILSNASLAETELQLGISPEISVREIARGAERAAGIVRQLLAFSREDGQAADLTAPFDVGGVVQEACDLVAPGLPGETSLTCHVAPGLPLVLGNPSDLHRVLLNLLTNAAHAVAGREGTIVVSVDTADRPPDPSGGDASTRSVRICVDDDGPGIPAAILERIFDAFFTTKPTGQGTGLGLAAAQSIVREYGGTIFASNRPEGGSRFTILLPPVGTGTASPATPTRPQPMAAPTPDARPVPEPAVAAGQAPTAAAAEHGITRSTAAAGGGPSPSLGEAGRPHVLFVDDEAPLTRLAERAMPALGFSVTTFTDPTEALATLMAEPSRFDALVTDLSMPGMTGLELVAELRKVRPDLPVVLSSGFLTPANRQLAIREGVNVIVPKPCSLGELADAVVRVLEDQP